MKARDLMSRPVITVNPDTTIRQAATVLTEKGFAGGLLVYLLAKASCGSEWLFRGGRSSTGC